LLARATYKMVLFFTHIPFVVNHTINATPPERLQHRIAHMELHTQSKMYMKSSFVLGRSAAYLNLGPSQPTTPLMHFINRCTWKSSQHHIV